MMEGWSPEKQNWVYRKTFANKPFSYIKADCIPGLPFSLFISIMQNAAQFCFEGILPSKL
jgi:hypothetical protein